MPTSRWTRRCLASLAAVPLLVACTPSSDAGDGVGAGDAAEEVVDPETPEEPAASEDPEGVDAPEGGSALDDGGPAVPADPPDEEPETVDIRTVAWAEQEWWATCSDESEAEGSLSTADRVAVQLSPQPADQEWGAGWEHRGGREFAGEANLPVYEVDLDGVLYGDVTGDGRDDAIFASSCRPDDDATQLLEVWTIDQDGTPVHLPLPLLLSKYSGTLEEYDAVDGQLWTRHRVPTPGTIEEVQPYAHSLEVVTLRTFNGTSWDADEVSREEPPEPVDGVGQASPPDDLDNATVVLTVPTLIGENRRFVLRDGRSEPDGDGWSVQRLREPVFGDVTGNGEDDAVMVLDVRVDGTSREHHLVAYDHDGVQLETDMVLPAEVPGTAYSTVGIRRLGEESSSASYGVVMIDAGEDYDGYPTQAPPSDYRPVHSIYFYFQGATQVEAPPVS